MHQLLGFFVLNTEYVCDFYSACKIAMTFAGIPRPMSSSEIAERALPAGQSYDSDADDGSNHGQASSGLAQSCGASPPHKKLCEDLLLDVRFPIDWLADTCQRKPWLVLAAVSPQPKLTRIVYRAFIRHPVSIIQGLCRRCS